jgi:hypothetical protein
LARVLEKYVPSNQPQPLKHYLRTEIDTAFNTSAPTGFNSFAGTFSVPDAPAKEPAMLYFFPGLQNVDWIPKVDPEVPGFDIIQPVLQYPGDLGRYWSVKNW